MLYNFLVRCSKERGNIIETKENVIEFCRDT